MQPSSSASAVTITGRQALGPALADGRAIPLASPGSRGEWPPGRGIGPPSANVGPGARAVLRRMGFVRGEGEGVGGGEVEVLTEVGPARGYARSWVGDDIPSLWSNLADKLSNLSFFSS